MDEYEIVERIEQMLETNEEHIAKWTELNNRVRNHKYNLKRDCVRMHCLGVATSLLLSWSFDNAIVGVIAVILSAYAWYRFHQEFNPQWDKLEQDNEDSILGCIQFREQYTELLKEYRGY